VGVLCNTKLSKFYQWTEVREKFKLKDGEKCIWFRIVKSNACKLSGRTSRAYIGNKSQVLFATLHGPLHMGFSPFGSVLREHSFL
jgi:hypothetical protein